MNERRRVSPLMVGCILAILAVGLAASGLSAQDKADKSKDAAPKGPTLYQRMGGYDVISNVVDDFIDQLRKDTMFDRFGHGRAKDSSMKTKQLVKEFICWKTDGPCAYIGRDMAESHQGLEITVKEWETSTKMLQASLEKFKVPEKEQKEFMALVEKLREDIVEKPKKEEKKPAGN
jgi:hemoglobin